MKKLIQHSFYSLLFLTLLISGTSFASQQNTVFKQQAIGRIEGTPDFSKTRSVQQTSELTTIMTNFTDLEKQSQVNIEVKIKDKQLFTYKESFDNNEVEVKGRVSDDKFILNVKQDNESEDHEFELSPSLQVGESMPFYITQNWDKLMQGEKLSIEMIVPLRGMAISMTAVRELSAEPASDEDMIKIKIQASNFFLRMLGKPSYLWFAGKTKRMIKYEGPLVPVKELASSSGLPPRGSLQWTNTF